MTPQEALNKAKVQLMTKSGTLFLSSIFLGLEHKLSNEVPTAGTDGLCIMYNPEYFLKLAPAQRVGLIAHETYHIAFMHMIRNKGKDKLIYNIAGDYVINILLTDNKFELPENGYVDAKFRGWSTEQVYEYLMKENTQPPPNYVPDVMDSELTKEQEEKIVNVVVQSIQQTEMNAGKVPGEIERVVEDLINPKLSWRDILYRFVDTKSKEEQTWKKPNKKYLPNFYLPTNYSDHIDTLTVAIDTSGSISKEVLSSILSEIDYINITLKPNNLTILDCDYRIHNIYKVDSFTSINELRFTGNGGTSFRPVIDYCKKNETNLLVYFTDLEGTQIQEEQTYPILWICYSNHKPAPIGETIYVSI